MEPKQHLHALASPLPSPFIWKACATAFDLNAQLGNETSPASCFHRRLVVLCAPVGMAPRTRSMIGCYLVHPSAPSLCHSLVSQRLLIGTGRSGFWLWTTSWNLGSEGPTIYTGGALNAGGGWLSTWGNF